MTLRAVSPLWTVLVALACGLGGALAGGRARADDKPAAKASAWENRVYVLSANDFRAKDDWKACVERNGGDELKADAEFKGMVLDYLGRDGWELVQVVVPFPNAKNEIVQYYLRRPKG